MTDRLTSHKCAAGSSDLRPRQNPHLSSCFEASAGLEDPLTLPCFREKESSIVVVHGLFSRQQLVSAPRPGKGPGPVVKLPLSDWILKYSSTIWHHPPALVTRNISRRYCDHILICIPVAIICEWTRSKLRDGKVNLPKLNQLSLFFC